MLLQKILKIMFSKLAECEKLVTSLAVSHEISTHARETTQKSVSLMANPRDLQL